jgi:hypothetical protein
MRIANLENSRTKLRPMVDSDLPVFFRWMSDTRNLHLWWADREILSFDQFVDDFRRRDRGFFGHFFTVQEISEQPITGESSVICNAPRNLDSSAKQDKLLCKPRSAKWQEQEEHSTPSSSRKWYWKSSAAARAWQRHAENTV